MAWPTWTIRKIFEAAAYISLETLRERPTQFGTLPITCICVYMCM